MGLAEPTSSEEVPCGPQYGRGRPCDKRSNCPPSPYPNTLIKVAGDPVGIDVRTVPMMTDTGMNATSGCLTLPLKSGRVLSLQWNKFSNFESPAFRDGWDPAGGCGTFSFLPSIVYYLYLDQPNLARRISDQGNVVYGPGSTTPYGALPYSAVVSFPYFTEYEQRSGTYYEYWFTGYGPPAYLYGRLNRQYDTVGNQLFYNYSPNTTGNLLLRSITGDIAGNLVPYFFYADETINNTVHAPITQISIVDTTNPANMRTAYFSYTYFGYVDDWKTPWGTQPLTTIVNPAGCSAQFQSVIYLGDPGGSTITYGAVDADGYTTYFQYWGEPNVVGGELHWTTEREGLVTYFNPGGDEFTPAAFETPINRNTKEHWYKPNQWDYGILQDVDSYGHTTYFVYLPAPTAGIGFPQQKTDRLGNTKYYEYVAGGVFGPENALAVSREVWAFNGASTYYGYDQGHYDLSLLVGPRSTASFPVATYYKYDGFRNRVSRVDPLGNATLYGRDFYGKITQIQDARQNVTYFTFSTSTAYQDSQVLPDGSGAYFGYDSFGDVLRVVSPRWTETGGFASFTTYYDYDQLGRRTKTVDPLGEVTYYNWTGRSDPLDSVDALGNELAYTYNGNRQITQVTVTTLGGTQLSQTKYGYDIYMNRSQTLDPRGNTTYFFYDQLDRRTARKDALKNTTYFSYDPEGNLKTLTDPRKNTTYYFYDLLSRRTARRDALGNPTYYFYDLADNRSAIVDAKGNPSYFFYDQLDRLQTTRDALANPTYFYFDPVGSVSASTNARFYTSYFAYDSRNRRTAAQDALGNVTYFVFDRASNLTRTMDARLNTTTVSFDTLDRPQTVTDALGNSTYFFYDAVGNRTQLRDARGSAAYFFYDGLRRTQATRDALGESTYFYYDPSSNRTVLLNANAHATYFGYDVLNRLTAMQDALGKVTYFEFDAVSNLTKVLDPNLNAVQNAYDTLNRPSALRMPDGGSSYFFYDALSNKTKNVDPLGKGTYYAYDALNRLSTIQDALGRTLYFQYDAVSNRSKAVNAEGSSCAFTYDAINRRTNLAYTASGADVSASLGSAPYFVYDPSSNLTQVGDLWGLHLMGYDSDNRLVRHQFANQSVVYFQYDAVSNLTGRVYPGTSGTAAAAYDAINRQIRVQAPSGATAYFAYNAVSNLTQRFLGNGAYQAVTYDADERVSQWRTANKSGASLTYFDYTRDPKGRITKAVREATYTVYYTYDSCDRLASEIWAKTGTTPSEVYGYRYAYDLAGNRTKLRANGANTYYFYDRANQLTVSGSTSAYATPTYYIYDKNGSLTNLVEPAGATYFAYNAAGLVARIKWKDASLTYFFYDGNLNRYGMVTFGTATYFLWDGPNLLQQLNANGTVKEEYTNARMPLSGIGQLLEINRPGQTPQKLYPVMDPRGTVTKQLQSDGATVQASREYDAFGNIIPNSASGTWIGLFGYQGQAWLEIGSADGSKRLLLSPTRIYDPVTGRFLQSEPVLRKRIGSHYCYCAGNPANSLDPMGKDILDTLGIRQVGQKLYGIAKEASESFNDTVLGLAVIGSNTLFGTDIKLEDVPFASQSAQGTKQAILQGGSSLWVPATREVKTLIDFSSVGLVPIVEQEVAAVKAYDRGRLTDDQFQERLNDITYSAEANAIVGIVAKSPQIDSIVSRVGDTVYDLIGPDTAPARVTTETAPELPPGWDYDWDLRYGMRKASDPHWFDPEGGEWRWDPGNEYHNPHWDYNPWDTIYGKWTNVPGWEGLEPRTPNCPNYPEQNILPEYEDLLGPRYRVGGYPDFLR